MECILQDKKGKVMWESNIFLWIIELQKLDFEKSENM